MKLAELIKRLQSMQKEIGGDGETNIGSHELEPDEVDFMVSNPELDIDFELEDIEPNMLPGCSCWSGVTIVLKAKVNK